MRHLITLAALLTIATATSSTSGASLAAGRNHACAVDSRGGVFCWGDNVAGQLGNGSIDAELRVVVDGLGESATAVAAGYDYTCGLLASGRVFCWGANESGQLGDGTTVPRGRPAAVAGLEEGAASIAAGATFACAVTPPGGVKCWGSINGSTTAANVPGLAGAKEVAAGWSHACVLSSAGGVKCWGANGSGQLGDGTTDSSAMPAEVVGLSAGIAAIAAQGDRTCAVTASGAVKCWGANSLGGVGDGTTQDRSRPVDVAGLVGVRSVVLSNSTTCVLTTAGGVKCWGGDRPSQGNGYGEASLTPVDVTALTSGVASIAGGSNHFCATTVNGELVCWGGNDYGARGIARIDAVFPVTVPRLLGVASAAGGGKHTCARLATGAVTCWGSNQAGQLGSDGAGFHNVAEQVRGLAAGATSVAAMEMATCALLVSGEVQCWGSNQAGQLGNAGVEDSALPQFVQGLGAGATSLAAGGFYACAIAADTRVRCWGGGDYRTAREIPGLPGGIRGIAANDQFGCAITAGQRVKCWGPNEGGRLGSGSTDESPLAVDVAGIDRDVIALAAGRIHACALLSSGGVKCWGWNDGGRLGDGTTVNRTSAVDVVGLPPGVVAIRANFAQTCALTASGAVWCWGGYDQADPRLTPRPVSQWSDGVTELRFGLEHLCAQFVGGGVNCFGDNRAGQVGDGTRITYRATSESVVAPDRRSFLDVTREDGLDDNRQSKFVAVTRGFGATTVADLAFPARDIGKAASTFVFALAPATIVQGTAASQLSLRAKTSAGKDTPIPCVLAQLNAAGQMVAVSSANLVAYVTGILSTQGQSVSILNGIPAINIGGATFYVGYGSSGNAMIETGTNRGILSVPGAVECKPQPPQTGWWWNPAEDGRGFSIERRGNNLFFAAFLYDASGRSTWHVATGPVSLDGAFYSGPLLTARGGQTLDGAYRGSPTLTVEGVVNLAFNTGAEGTMVWPGGTVPIQRFNIVPNGLNLPAVAAQPESGWWWNEQEPGRGFFMEWQNGTLDIAGYMYDDAGNPVWYLTVGEIGGTPAARTFSGTWWSYSGGQTLTGSWRQNARTNSNVAPMTITFTAPDAALMTLPNGRTTALRRHRF